MPRPSGSALNASAGARRPVDPFHHRVAIEPQAEFERDPIAQTPAVLRKHRELRAVDLLFRTSAELDALRERPIKTTDLDRSAGTRAVVLRLLKVGAELEHVLTAPQVPRQAQRLDPLQARDVAFLVVEESAALRLGRVHHRRMVGGVHVDLEPAYRECGLDDQIRPNRKPVDGAGRPAALIEIGRHLDRTKRVHRDVPDFARKQNQSAAERVTGRQDAVDTRERVEASQIDLGLVRQAPDWRVAT